MFDKLISFVLDVSIKIGENPLGRFVFEIGDLMDNIRLYGKQKPFDKQQRLEMWRYVIQREKILKEMKR